MSKAFIADYELSAVPVLSNEFLMPVKAVKDMSKGEEFSFILPERRRMELSLDPHTMELLRSLPPGGTMRITIAGEDRDYRIRRRDWKRSKVWLVSA